MHKTRLINHEYIRLIEFDMPSILTMLLKRAVTHPYRFLRYTGFISREFTLGHIGGLMNVSY